MGNAWRVSALMSGLVMCLAPAAGHAAVVYRVGGNTCTPMEDEYSDYAYLPHGGFEVHGIGTARAECPIPTSPSTFDAATLSHVNVRYYLNGVSNEVEATLWFHDYDSHSYVECESDWDSNVSAGFGMLEISKECSGYEDSWAVGVEVSAFSVGSSESLVVKLISVYE